MEGRVLGPVAVQAQGLAAFRLAAVAAYPEKREKRPGNIQPCGLAASRPLLPFFRLHGIKVLAPIAVQAQGLRPFVMWLSPHIHPKKSGPENLQAVFRPRLFRSTAGKRRAGSRPAVFRYVAVATYSSRKVPAGESASGFPAGIFRDDCAACRKNKKSVDNG